MISRILICLFFATSFAAARAYAQDYPSKPIKIVVPLAAGGVADIVTRVFSAKIGEDGKTTVVVENRAGGAGIPGAESVAKSPARRLHTAHRFPRRAVDPAASSEAAVRSGEGTGA